MKLSTEETLSWALHDHGELTLRRVPVYVDGYNAESDYAHKVRYYEFEVEVGGIICRGDSVKEALQELLGHL